MSNFNDKNKPKILAIKGIAQSRLFHVEQVDLRFSNGQERSFERLKAGGRNAVIVVAIVDADTVLLIKEYAAGTDRYELCLPKGLVHDNEDVLVAANRELQEEVGYAARNLQYLTALTLAPHYMTHTTDLIMAKDLYPSKLEGDEPEPLEVVPYRLDELDELILTGQMTESRSIAGLYIVKNYLKSNKVT